MISQLYLAQSDERNPAFINRTWVYEFKVK